MSTSLCKLRGLLAVSPLVLLALVLGIAVAGTAAAQPPIVIDFESAPGPDGELGTGDDILLTECTTITNQFSSLGVNFSLVQGGNPVIATQGSPIAGFVGGVFPRQQMVHSDSDEH